MLPAAKQHTFPEVLHSMEGEGVGVADVQFVQTQLMKKKNIFGSDWELSESSK